MRVSLIMRTLLAATLALGAPGLAAEASAEDEPKAARPDQSPDAWITTKAKIAVLGATGVRGTDVNVDTVNGFVTLHGKVTSSEEKKAAEKAVRNLDGVKEVRNLLQIVAVKDDDVVEKSDDEIEAQLAKALRKERRLSDSEVSVQSVNDGTVLLGGRAETVAAHLRALEVARGTPGVRAVHSEIESPDQRADEELLRRYGVARDAARGGQDLSSQASDAWITSKAKLRLFADSRTPGLDINVDTRNGVVTLFGTVPTEDAKKAAEEEARQVSGVRRVVSDLQVVPAERQQEVAARDAEVERKLEEALRKDDDLANADIEVEVYNGVARLTGTVPGAEEREAARNAALEIAGVRSVRSELEVRPE